MSWRSQNDRVEVRAFVLTLKSQLAAEQPQTEGRWNAQKKYTPGPRTKEMLQ